MENMEPKTRSLTPEDFTRFSRHILLSEVGVRGQERLKGARILLIGAGGLGSPISLYLAAAGIGTIGLVEFDVIDRSNLQRQILYADADVGRLKSIAARERLQALAPDINIETFAEPLTVDNALKIIEAFDIVIDGTDNFATRYLVNDACVLLGKPNVYGSIFRFDGQASVFDARRGPCYRCLFPSAPPAEQVPNCAEGGVLGVLPGLIGMLQATEALKLVLGIGSSLVGRLITVDALSMSFGEYKISKDAACQACGEGAALKFNKDLQLLHAQDTQRSCTVNTQADSEKTPTLSVEELHQWRSQSQPHVLLDVRGANELDICRIHGSVHIPLTELDWRFKELPLDQPIVVHCKSGARSQRAVTFLMQQGLHNTFNLTGGILAWIDRVDTSLAKY